MVTLAEGLRLAGEGAAGLGKGLETYGKHRSLSSAAQRIREENPEGFIGGAKGQEQAALRTRLGEFAQSDELRKKPPKNIEAYAVQLAFEQGNMDLLNKVMAAAARRKRTMGSEFPTEIPSAEIKVHDFSEGNLSLLGLPSSNFEKGVIQTKDIGGVRMIGDKPAEGFLENQAAKFGVWGGKTTPKGQVREVINDPFKDFFAKMATMTDEEYEKADAKVIDYADSIIVKDIGKSTMNHFLKTDPSLIHEMRNSIKQQMNLGYYEEVGGELKRRKLNNTIPADVKYFMKNVGRAGSSAAQSIITSGKKSLKGTLVGDDLRTPAREDINKPPPVVPPSSGGLPTGWKVVK